MDKRLRRIAGMGCALALAVLSAAALLAEETGATTQVELVAQPLAQAIQAVARQANINILVDPRLVAGRQAPALKAQLTVNDVLNLLLQGTGLTPRFVDDKTVTLIAADTAATPVSSTPPVDQPFLLAQAESASQDAPSALEALEEIVVTGTHIRGATPAGAPLTVYSREDIDRSGVATVEDFLRTVPQNFALQDASTRAANAGEAMASNATFGAAVNLHGLGTDATLVLIDGQRLAPSGTDASFVDVSTLPLSAIERIEVLTDGASAVYGADAVAGVVNFILKKDYSGAETSATVGSSSRGGGGQRGVSQLVGKSWGTGGISAAVQFDDRNPVAAGDRDFVSTSASGVIQPDTALLPSQQLLSGFIAAQQELSSTWSITAEALAGRRRYAEDQGFLGSFIQKFSGSARQAGMNVDLSGRLPRAWRMSLLGNYALVDQENTSTTISIGGPPFVVLFDAKTRVYGGEIKGDGPLFELSGGPVRAAIGLAARHEKFEAVTSFLNTPATDRDVLGVYGEFDVPLIGRDHPLPWAQQLSLSAAVRYDHYSDFGSSVNPKIGILWRPVGAIALRGTYGRSFRAPNLGQIADQGTAFQLTPVFDPSAPSGSTNTVFVTSRVGTPGLKAERSQAFTIGLDFTPAVLAGLNLSATYFHVDFDDRIAMPPSSNSASLFDDPVLQPFIDRAPTSGEIAEILASPNFTNSTGVDPPVIEAIFDSRLKNLASTTNSGVELSARYPFKRGASQFGLFCAAVYLIDMDVRSAPLADEVDILNKTYNPADLRIRSGADWTLGGLASSLVLNYTTGYRNTNVIPTVPVSSWLTADWQLSYRMSDEQASLLSGMKFTLSVLNVTDKRPPFVASTLFGLPFNYDATNASPLGRFVTGQIAKSW